MSHAATHHGALTPEHLTLRPGSTSAPSMLLMLLGAVGLVAALVFGFAGGGEEVPAGKVVLAAYQAGAIVALAMTLGAMAFVMILHQVNAGWAALPRRQAEHVMSFVPHACGLVAIALIINLLAPKDILLFKWMDADYVAPDPIYAHKAGYLNTPFWIVRALVYFAVWIWLSRSLYRMSREQDRTGDRWITASMRRRSSYGLLLFAFTIAFAAFDWLMSLDYHWFSTMFGVYFFAQAMGAALATVILAMLWFRRAGRARELTTVEHLHDMGKLLFGFTAFWGYIAFSQYFLIWYAAIPEETSWFIRRRTDEWAWVSVALAVCRFVVPFVILLPKPSKRSPLVLAAMSVWILVFSVFDLLYVVRGQVYGADGVPLPLGAMDAIAAGAPILLLLGLIMKRMTSTPGAPPNDPRIEASLHHKNYV
jgi:hypothetical protein